MIEQNLPNQLSQNHDQSVISSPRRGHYCANIFQRPSKPKRSILDTVSNHHMALGPLLHAVILEGRARLCRRKITTLWQSQSTLMTHLRPFQPSSTALQSLSPCAHPNAIQSHCPPRPKSTNHALPTPTRAMQQVRHPELTLLLPRQQTLTLIAPIQVWFAHINISSISVWKERPYLHTFR